MLYKRIIAILVVSILVRQRTNAQQKQWQHELAISSALSIMTVKTNNERFTNYGRAFEPPMPYGIIPKSTLVPQSTLQWHLGLNYALKHKSGMVFNFFMEGNEAVNAKERLVTNGDLETSSNFQFYRLNIGLGFDFLPKKLDEDLILLLSGGGVYSRYITNHYSYPNGEPSTPFQEVGEEQFVRKDFSFGWGAQLRWVDYFSEHWGYCVFWKFSSTYTEPSQMTMTRFLVNSTDKLNTLNTRQREYVFGDVVDDDPSDINEPKILSTEFYKYRFFTLGAGVNYRF